VAAAAERRSKRTTDDDDEEEEEEEEEEEAADDVEAAPSSCCASSSEAPLPESPQLPPPLQSLPFVARGAESLDGLAGSPFAPALTRGSGCCTALLTLQRQPLAPSFLGGSSGRLVPVVRHFLPWSFSVRPKRLSGQRTCGARCSRLIVVRKLWGMVS
jgi:hypothetical protein